MRLAIASGKGGTGKTLFAASIALSYDNISYYDLDIEEPDGHIFLKPENIKTKNIIRQIPEINAELCKKCGKCRKICKFNAIFQTKEKIMIIEDNCRFCGGCFRVCPQNALKRKDHVIGVLRKGTFKNNRNRFIEGKLKIGRNDIVSVIDELKHEISSDKQTTIIDCPPGSSKSVCRVIGIADYSLFITEPTEFGINDLFKAIEMAEFMNVPYGVIVNKLGIGNVPVKKICEEKNIDVIGEFPYSSEIASHYANGIITEHSLFKNILAKIERIIL